MDNHISELSPEDIAASWMDKFQFKKEDKDKEISGLRSPQLGALHAIFSHIEMGEEERAIIVMPTGTGKTETMLSFLIANQCTRTLVLVPSDALRTQIGDKYSTLGVLKDATVVDHDALLPKVLKVKKKMSKEEWEKAVNDNNVIVTTMSLITLVEDNIKALLKSKIDYLVVDEAHHSQASTWAAMISSFPCSKTFLFTATPYRNDGKKLDGRIIFNYSLRKAQQEGYYQPIEFHPVCKYNREDGDMEIAKEAVAVLKRDRAAGYEHILMARCKDTSRAEEIFKIYEKYEEFNPILIHSRLPGQKRILEDIKQGKHQIVVCVNMLGEGFDLPSLKIAAIHDERQSLPITLQFIGRFTRNAKNLGTASFVTNIAYAPIKEEINSLYQQDADWNLLLPRMSDGLTKAEKDAQEYLSEFKGKLRDEFSMSDIRPALSAEVFTSVGTTTSFGNWEEGININGYKYKRWAASRDMLVIVLGKETKVDWGDVSNIENLTWDLIVVYFEARYKRVYLNSTLKIRGENLLKAIFGEVVKINNDKVFRIFAGVKRLMLTNIGARRPQGKDVSFQSFVGSSVSDGISDMTKGKLAKNNVFGIGYRDGTKCSLGCSIKGKLWSRERAGLDIFKKWCNEMGALVANDAIDQDKILDEFLKIKPIKEFPRVNALSIDWPDEIYENGVLQIKYGAKVVNFDDCILEIEEQYETSTSMILRIVSDEFILKLRYRIGKEGHSYEVVIPKDKPLSFTIGRNDYSADDFFNEHLLKTYLADGRVIYGNHIIDTPTGSPMFNAESLIGIDWGETKLQKESQKATREKDSIQYYFSKFIENDYAVLVDDDGCGEAADLVGINDSGDFIDITLFHLKFAIDGKVSQNINNLYQVCGQAIKSVRWKYRHPSIIFDSLLSRDEKKLNRGVPSSILKGTKTALIKLKEQAGNAKGIRFHVSIVQPGVSQSSCSEEMLMLLGNVQQYLQDVSAIDLKVYCSK